MNIFDLVPTSMPSDAEYYFNILVINVAIRESLQKEQEKIISNVWDISCITKPRPYIIHLYTADDNLFEQDENFIIELYPNKAIEISASSGISFYNMFDEDEDKDDEEDWDIGEISDLNDLWRL